MAILLLKSDMGWAVLYQREWEAVRKMFNDNRRGWFGEQFGVLIFVVVKAVFSISYEAVYERTERSK